MQLKIIRNDWADVSHKPPGWVAERWLYAAYGSNLNLEQMQKRCPTAHLHSRGVIPDASLLFSRVLSIRHAPLSEVPVGLYELKAADVVALDRYEGMQRKVYSRKLVAVNIQDVGYVRCFTYVKNTSHLHAPSAEYMSRCLQGYKDWNFQPSRLYRARAAAEKVSPAPTPAPGVMAEILKATTSTPKAELPVRDVEWGVLNNESYWREAGGGPWHKDTTTPEDAKRGVVTGVFWRPSKRKGEVRRPTHYRDADNRDWWLHADGVWKRTPPSVN
jgi:hypothetical protein